jgi:ribosomal protein S18 acetylase RimI-like enzyme
MSIQILTADYENQNHARHVVQLLNRYAQDPMGGGGAGLAPPVTQKLIAEMKRRPQCFSILAYVDEQPAGLVNCIESFSSFSASSVVNIHDVFVAPSFRGQGISRLMFDRVVEMAREKDCCKLTLEVLEGNQLAQNAYRKYGFEGYELTPELGKAMFWQMKID